MDKENSCKPLCSHRNLLGEGPLWDESKSVLYWVDIQSSEIHEWDSKSDRHQIYKFPVRIGAIAKKTSGGFIAATEKGFANLSIPSCEIHFIGNPEEHLVDNRFNDGKCDKLGRFWAGTLNEQGIKEAAALYKLDHQGKFTKMLSNVSCSNGIAWSSDHRHMFYIDTSTRCIDVFDFDLEAGLISNRQLVLSIPATEGIPDGMTIDQEGKLWVALWGGGKVIQVDPIQGAIIGEIKVPAKLVTSCTFGGKDFKDLFITTASVGYSEQDLEEQPLAGYTFVVNTMAVAGMPLYPYQNTV